MKTLQLKTLPLLLVELPEGARDIQVYKEDLPEVLHWTGCNGLDMLQLPDGEWDMIGKLSNLPDEWFEQYVEPERTFDYTKHLWDYVKEEYVPMCYISQSFYSLLEAKEQVYLKGNPCGDEAQSRTFDPDRTYIFELKR